MRYPDGTNIVVGDWIWWNEGTCVGSVAMIIANDEEISHWGLNERGLFISNDLSGKSLSCDVFNSEDQMAEEGIAKLTEVETQEVREVIRCIINENLSDDDYQFSVRLKMTSSGKAVWLVIPRNGNKK